MKQLTMILGMLFICSSLTNAQADCKAEPPNGLSPLAAYSIFYQNYRNGDYEFALDFGRWIACAKPEKIEGNPKYTLQNQYDRLTTIYEEISKEKEDPAIKSAYLDTAATLYNESLELFGNNEESRFDIIFNRGRFFQQNYNYIDDGLQKAYSDYLKLFEIDPERAISMGDGYYLRQALNNLINNGSKEEAQAFIDKVKPIAEGDALDFIEEKQQELLGSPEEQIAYFEPIVEENPQDADAWRALKNAYEETENREKLFEALTKLNELNPTYENALDLAEQEKSNANYASAAKYFEQALKRASNDEQKKEIYLDLADVNISLENLAKAKRYVQQALEIDPNDGTSYIKMATIYGTAVTQCTEDRNIEAQDKVVYWLVIDYLNKAKSVDSSVRSTVDRQLSQYEEVTPNAEDKFFTLEYEEGQKVTIDGSLSSCYSFINETVTVR